MREGFALRVGRILSGSLNALVDALENAAPEVVMAEALREIDGAVDEVRGELGRAVAARHLATKRLAEEQARHQSLEEKIQVAIREERDDLAEAAIARQLDLEAQMPILETAIAERAAAERELHGYLQALQAKKREMQDEFRDIQAAANAGVVSLDGYPSGGAAAGARVDRAASAFDRALERATGLAAPDSRGLDRQAAGRLAELDELARENRVRERLAALKAGGNQE